MPDWGFWKVFLSGTAATILTIFAIIEGVKHLLPSKAKPQLLDAQNCFIRPSLENNNEIRFELLVNNAGLRGCSIISINLKCSDGLNAELGHKPSTPLPKAIPAETTERVVMFGYGKFKLQPDQKSIEVPVVLKFNPKHIIEKKIDFIISHSNYTMF